MAFLIALAVIVSSLLSDKARMILAGAICGAGILISISMLIILVRQYNREG